MFELGLMRRRTDCVSLLELDAEHARLGCQSSLRAVAALAHFWSSPPAGCPRPPLPVQLLLERGADATLQNDEFKTPAQLAERGTPARQLLEAAQRQAEAAAAEAQPEVPPPAAEVA